MAAKWTEEKKRELARILINEATEEKKISKAELAKKLGFEKANSIVASVLNEVAVDCALKHNVDIRLRIDTSAKKSYAGKLRRKIQVNFQKNIKIPKVYIDRQNKTGEVRIKTGDVYDMSVEGDQDEYKIILAFKENDKDYVKKYKGKIKD